MRFGVRLSSSLALYRFMILSLTACLLLLLALDVSLETIFLGIVSLCCLYGLSRMHLKLFRTETQLREQFRLLEAGYLAVPYGVLVFDDSGKCRFMNDIARKIFPGEEISNFSDLLDRFTTHRKMLEALKRFSAEGIRQPRHFDAPLALIKGAPLWWRVMVAPLSNFSGWVAWSFIDLTPSAQHLDVPEANPILLLETLDNSPIGYFCVDAYGKIIFCTRTFARWLGTTAKDLVGTLVRDLFVNSSQVSLPGEGGTEGFERSSPKALDLEGFEKPRPVLVQHLFSRDETNMYSITSRAFSAPTLEEEGGVLPLQNSAGLFSEAPIGVLVLDKEGYILSCNDALCTLLQKERKDIVQQPLLDNIAPNDREMVKKKLKLLSTDAPQENRSFEAALEAAGIPQLSILFHVESLPSIEASSSPRLRLYLANVTKYRFLEERFVQAQKMQAVGQLAGGIAHDFNNLLTAMIGYCDLLLARYSPAEHAFTDVMQIKQNANRASNLVRQLLAFSRQQTMQPRVLDVANIVSELSTLLQRLLGAKIALDVVYGRDLGLVQADPTQLEQVIINIAVNARDAMPDGGTLIIRTYAHTVTNDSPFDADPMPPGRYAAIEIRDTGSGIAESVLPKIFDPFFSTKPKGAGTGLGLATVHGIVKQMDGFLRVKSAVNVGTMFSVFLPVREDIQEEISTQTPPAAAKLLRDLTGMGTILLVEDEAAVRMFGARALRDKGYDVIETNDGEMALDYLQHHSDVQIDLLISDVIMPKVDGLTLLRELRRIKPTLKVLFISGYTEDSFRQSIGDDPYVQFLSKPFDIKDLAEKVKSALT